MLKFLHIADIHLGNRQYKLAERELDFFRAFSDICSPESLQNNQIDLIIIAGDLFDMRNISADVYNQAVYVFGKIKELGIPVITIEGNHDLKEVYHYSSQIGSWYEALAQNQLLYFLYPDIDEDNNLRLLPVKETSHIGGYLDLVIKGQPVRIIGSQWHGSNSGKVLSQYSNAIKELPETEAYKIFLYHSGHEDYLPSNRGGILASEFQCLEGLVDYIGLGHIHESYVKESSKGKAFIFNPGSLEANSIAEVDIDRGGFLVEIKAETSIDKIQYSLLTDYYQRKFIRYKALVHKYNNEEHLFQTLISELESVLSQSNNNLSIVIVELEGYLQYEISNQFLEEMKGGLSAKGALHCLIKKNFDSPYGEQQYALEQLDRGAVEEKVYREIVESNGLPLIGEGNCLSDMINIKEGAKNRKDISAQSLLDILP